MAVRLTIMLAVLAGCGVRLDPGGPADSNTGDPADVAVDARPDAPPDARLCTGGDGHMTDQTGSCFVFFVGPKIRADAQATCVAMGAHLAVITSADANAVVALLALNVDAFVGATDLVTEGSYLWPDGTGLTYTNWRTGEPNNGSGQFEEDCMIIEGANNGSWDDRPCAVLSQGIGSYAYVCQY